MLTYVHEILGTVMTERVTSQVHAVEMGFYEMFTTKYAAVKSVILRMSGHFYKK